MIQYSFIGYMIASAIVMIGCVIAYRYLLENKVLPSANRLMLLSIFAISFLVPLVSSFIPESGNGVGFEVGKLEFAGVPENVGPVQEEINIGHYFPKLLRCISMIYFIGLFITFLFSLMAIGQLIYILRKSRTMEIAGARVFVHENEKLSTFSWGNKIFLYKKALGYKDRDMEMLISHEQAHLDKAHWMDLALAQVVLIFQWFNPAAWFMKRELQRIHEYEADMAVLQSGIEEKDYQMLLIQNISRSRYSGLIDGLNNCSLKKRIIMMKKTTFKKDRITRGIAVCGFAFLGGLIIHIPAVAKVLEVSSDPLESADKVFVINGEAQEEEAQGEAYDYLAGLKSEEDFSGMKKKGDIENYPDAYNDVDKIAEYEGGERQLLQDLSMNIDYPAEAKENDIQGRVVVRFQINTNGTLSNCEIAYSQNPVFNEAALKAVENLPGKWKPAEVDGKPVASIFNIPVTFRLQSREEDNK